MRSAPGNLRRYLAYARPYRGALLLATLVGVAKFNLPVAFPWLFKDAIDNVLSGKESRLGLGLDGLMALGVGVFLAYALIAYLRTQLSDRIGQRMMRDVRQDLFRHLQRLPLGFFHARQTGAVVSRLAADVSIAQQLVSLAFTNVFMELTTLVSITAVLFAMNPSLAWLAYATLPLYLLMHRWIATRMRENAAEASRRRELLEGDAFESLAGVADVKSFTREAEEERRFAERCRDYLEASFANIRTHATSLGLTALLTRVPPVAVVWVGAHFVLRGELTVGELMAFYAYLEMVYSPLGRLSDMNVRLAQARAAIDRLFEFLDEAPEPRRGGKALCVRRGEIRFEGVVFGYLPGVPVLRGVDLRIAPGSCVALVGPSGAGKSTLAKLLVGFHAPWQGRISIDGQDLAGTSLESLRAAIAMVPQEPVLFSGSVEENLRFGRAQASQREVVQAAARANALEFIEALPLGFATPIGERGVRLSGGQRQRIAIARAFLKDAPILVMDESTSDLDPPAERLVHDAVERLMAGRTALVIAHRHSTVLRADSVLVLEAGRLVQQGRHAELARAAGSAYARLYAEELGLTG
jgi:subfamily B ATP-binding cassette protein MsbA